MPYLLALKANWKLLVGGLLLLLLAVQTVRLSYAERRADKAEFNLREARAELQRISTAKDEQGKASGRNIEKARDRSRDAEPKARRIETAPLPGNCATPREILQADL